MKAAIGILGTLVFAAAGWAQNGTESAILHPECIYFGAKSEHYSPLKGRRPAATTRDARQ